MPENTRNEDKTPAAEAEVDAKASDAKADATDSTKATHELTEDDLEAVAGGKGVYYGGGSPT